MKTKVNGAHVGQLDKDLKVHLYRDIEVDGLQIPCVLCEAVYGLVFRRTDQRGDGWTPVTLTVLQARYQISKSFYPAQSFYVEEANEN